ncbi:hypothetical protein CVD28_15775 [Bacillus sp. M6-12]|uniref:hypothetical protein n=1 Tax=Bacillus sp. M6-12 TaxID=2054166 RepID=UPI000C7849E5|nr:hypothetical protein [Bacillus sp. M6-12]PLS16542.1 hypothetical protein CVD28_15775 [Bacillus sp. M6-12]
MVKSFWRGSLSGLLAGTILGMMMKYVQHITEKEIYTLLLNVDFIPFLDNQNFGEPIEFIFHLAISFLLGGGYCILIASSKTEAMSGRIRLAISVTIPAILLYFPLSVLAEVPIVNSNDLHSFYYWMLCHLIFALLLAVISRLIDSIFP